MEQKIRTNTPQERERLLKFIGEKRARAHRIFRWSQHLELVGLGPDQARHLAFIRWLKETGNLTDSPEDLTDLKGEIYSR